MLDTFYFTLNEKKTPEPCLRDILVATFFYQISMNIKIFEKNEIFRLIV